MSIIKIGLIEVVVMFVEVMFLYREFVDALMPWFAQHSGGDFELGIFGILFVAGMAWFGIRGISWFLFAAHGTPTLMAIIKGSGVKSAAVDESERIKAQLDITKGFIQQIKNEMGDLQEKGDEVLGSFVIPPLQVAAAGLNFVTLLFSGQHIFDLPFKSMEQVMSSKILLHSVSRHKGIVEAKGSSK